MERPYALIAGNSNALLLQPFVINRPVTKLVELALLLRLQLIELVSRIAGGVALNAGSRDKIRSAEKLLPVFADNFRFRFFAISKCPAFGRASGAALEAV